MFPTQYRQVDMRTVLVNPTPRSNWIVDDILLCGAHPQSDTDVKDLLRCGVSTFISLVPMYQVEQKGLYKYWETLGNKIKFYNVPIPDQRTISDKKIFIVAHAIFDMMHRGEIVYVHCMHGHGRAGTVVGCVLQLVCDSDSTLGHIFAYIEKMHSSRAYGGGIQSPSTIRQITQVSRFHFFKNINVLIVCERADEVVKRELSKLNNTNVYTTCKEVVKARRKWFDWDAHLITSIDECIENIDIALAVVFESTSDNTIEKLERSGIYVRFIKPI